MEAACSYGLEHARRVILLQQDGFLYPVKQPQFPSTIIDLLAQYAAWKVMNVGLGRTRLLCLCFLTATSKT